MGLCPTSETSECSSSSAEELDFARAAQRLLLTPSRVSQVIRSLERRIGGPLFKRTSRSVALTPLGETLQWELKANYEAMEATFARARELVGGITGTLRLGTYIPVNGDHTSRTVARDRDHAFIAGEDRANLDAGLGDRQACREHLNIILPEPIQLDAAERIHDGDLGSRGTFSNVSMTATHCRASSSTPSSHPPMC
jgi:DNA-binding MarR family transcriptional regulator